MNVFLQNVRLILQAFSVLIIVLYIPGCALSYCLFPGRSIDRVERTFISASCSVVISSLIASLLTLVLKDLSRYTFSFTILCVNVVLICVAVLRNKSMIIKKPRYFLENMYNGMISLYNNHKKHIPFVALVIVFVLIFTLTHHAHSLDLTEFYLHPGHIDEIINTRLDHRTSIDLPLEIVNHGTDSKIYYIETTVDDKNIWRSNVIIVDAHEKWSSIINVPIQKINPLQMLEINLKSNEGGDSVARLRLWIGNDN